MKRPPLIAAAMLAVAATVAACGGHSTPASLDPKVAGAYVDAQAHALCLVQSNA